MNWQPIASAPKGRYIWAIEDGAWNGMPIPYQAMIYWRQDSRGGYWAEAGRPHIAMQPSHWMELPEVPPEYR